jgi:hypothetical protein
MTENKNDKVAENKNDKAMAKASEGQLSDEQLAKMAGGSDYNEIRATLRKPDFSVEKLLFPF